MGATDPQASRKCGVAPNRVRQIIFQLARMMRNLNALDEPPQYDELNRAELRNNREFWLRRLKALQQEWRAADRAQAANPPTPQSVPRSSKAARGTPTQPVNAVPVLRGDAIDWPTF